MRTLLALIPAIQLGISWWVTVSLLSSLWLIIKVLRKRRYASLSADAILLCTLAGMLISVSINPSSGMRDLLRVLREGLILLLLMQLANSFTANLLPFSEGHLKILIYVSLLQLVLCLAQYLFLLRGRYISLPFSFYGDRSSTLPDKADLIYSYIRPAGTFSEPSYLALVCVGLVICALTLEGKSGSRILVISCNSATILLSQSKLGYFGLISILLIVMSSKGSRKRVRLIHYFLVTLLTISSFALLQVLGNQAGSSYANRFRIPLQILPDFIQNNPFGLPFYVRTLENSYTKGNFVWTDVLHNSFYNIIFSYGVVSIFIFFLIYFNFRRRPLMMLFATLALMQNGSFLDFDKLFLVSLVSILSREGIVTVKNVESRRK
jgi:hypothetical protein